VPLALTPLVAALVVLLAARTARVRRDRRPLSHGAARDRARSSLHRRCRGVRRRCRRHGMNYRPTLAAKGGGRYVAEGLMFHMPGRWELSFDVDASGRRPRLATDLSV